MTLWPAWYSPPGNRMPAPMLIDYVARELFTTASDLVGPSRAARLVQGRAVIASVLRGRGLSTPVIGRILRREHSTILHALESVPAYCRNSTDFEALLARATMRAA